MSIRPSLKPREARRRDRREAILEVARRHFLENGYAATTMSAIATRLGGSKGTLWNYFPNKEELFAAVLRHATETYYAGMMQILEAQGELEPTLHRFSTNLLEKLTSADAIALHRLIMTEAGRFPQMGAIFFELAPNHTRTLLAQFLSRAMDQGLLRRADPALAARTLMVLTVSGSHQQIMLGQLTDPSPEKIKEDVDFAVDCFLHAYAPTQGPRVQTAH